LLEVNGSKIPESDPQPAIVSTGDNLVYKVRRFRPFGHREVLKCHAALTPDSGIAAPPDVTVCGAKDAGCLFTHFLNKKAFTVNVQQGFAIDGPDPDLAIFPREQHQLLIALRQTHRNNLIVAEAKQSVGTANPNVSFTILEELIGEPPGEAILFIERLQFGVMRTELPISQSVRIPDSYYSGV
jgi:hypothetical protein